MRQAAGLSDDALEIASVFAIGQFARERLELFKGKKALFERRFLGASDFDALPFLNRLHVRRSFMQAAARAGVQPGKPARQPMHAQQATPQIFHVHISDCDGKVHGDLPPGRGVVDFVPYLKEIAALGIDGAISIELEYSPEPEKIVEWVTEAYTATDRLMQQAGIRRE